jgi:endonuclease/exonuclease/phosphatase family metal-dependent hydrolase
MYKKAIVFLAFSIISGYKAQSQKKNYKVVAVAFYNLENYFDPADDPNRNDEDFTPNGANRYTKQVYAQKAHNMAYAISKLATDVTPDGPAIIGIAEVENDVALTYLVGQPEIKDRNYKFVWFYRSDRRGISTALLYNPKYFTVVNSESLFVDIAGNGDAEHNTTRDVLHVTGVLAGDTVDVFVNHWPSRRGGESATAPLRAIAATVAKKKIDSLMAVNPHTKVILMGDLNDDPIDPSITKALGAKSNKEKTGNNELFNPFTSYYKKGIGTGSFNNAWNLFDQIIISGTLLDEKQEGWRFHRSEVFNKDFLTQKFGTYKGSPHRSYDGSNWINGYSDHFPTIIYLVK